MAAGAFFGVLDLFGLGTIIETGRAHRAGRPFRPHGASTGALANLIRAQRDSMTADVLGFARGDYNTRPRRLAARAPRRP